MARFTAVAANRYYQTPEVALTNAGVCLKEAKRLEEAQQRFTSAIRACPNYSEATVQLASVYIERSKLPEARKAVDTYLGAFAPERGRAVCRGRRGTRQKIKMSERKILARPAS